MCSSFCVLTQRSSWELLKFKSSSLCVQVICVATLNKQCILSARGIKYRILQFNSLLSVVCSGKPLKRAQLSIRRGMCCIYERRHTSIVLFRIVPLILHLFSNYFLWLLDVPCKHTYWMYCVIIPYVYLLGLCPQRGTNCPTLMFSLQCRLEKLKK